ncbi:MORC family CW-type zinc finger protein 1 [Sorex araneus]|uniref:MORC family CW-type zinc finger protein 1 n=1 Tax=Sorex araneus TaxID=42254 RepID=UPI002433C1B9|nr:MORC family CW-type zinc finger protein 1 [Sorex araneus]
MGDKYASLQRAQLHLDFIHANSTTHSFLFGALAELLDNARDAGATRLDVFSVDNEKLQGGFMLCFLDDGCGMSPEEATDIIYFGTSKKRLSTLKFIGQYGNGLKSGSMRIGKDFILFTKKEETMTCVFLSQTFCEKEGLNEVVVPIPSWLTRSRHSITDDPQKLSVELSIIYKYSPFKTEAELMKQFDIIYGKCGTLLVVFNLKLLLSGEPELDVKTDKEDILMAGALEDFPERWSFRAYTSILYFDPWMRIFIQAKRVKTKHLCYSLYRPRKYQYVTSSFKGAFKNEVKKAEEAVKLAELMLEETRIKVSHPGRTSLSSPTKDILQKALEDVEAKHKILKEKKRELRKARTLFLFFGVNTESRNQAGMFIYSNNRLIKMHEKVGPQLKLKSLLGAGVVGIVNIPLEIMEPSHNKQEFLNVQEYNYLLKVMGQYLVQYCKDTGISNRNLTLFWNEFGNQNNENTGKYLDSIHSQRRDSMAIPFIIQCDLCLKWRILPTSTNYQDKESADIWICANNTNLLENSCDGAQRLPSIPLGTMGSVSTSKHEKEKQLQDSVQRYHHRLAEWQPQPQFIPPSRITEFPATCQKSAPKENMKTMKIRSLGKDLKRESLVSNKLSISHRGWKRNAEGAHSNTEFVSETNRIKTSMWKKVKFQQPRRPVTRTENVRLAEKPQASSWEMKRKRNQNLVQDCTTLIEVEDSIRDPDVILVLDESPADLPLKKEEQKIPLMKKAKQELCNDTPELKRNFPLLNWESVPLEDFNPCSGFNAKISVSGACSISSSPTEAPKSTYIKETVKNLLSNLREILHFVPEYQLPSEFGCTSVEQFVESCELERCPENTNKMLKMFFKQFKNEYMVQYEKNLRKKMQSIICDANRRGLISEVSLGKCEEKRKITEERLNNLRAKLALLLQKFQLGHPEDLEEIDNYVETLLLEDDPLLRNSKNKVTAGHNLSGKK